MATAAQGTLQATSITPSFTANDLEKSIKFYEGLGFAIEDRWEDNGKLVGVMLRAGSTQLGLSQDDWKAGRDRVKGAGMRVFIGVGSSQDVDELAASAQANGVTITREPHDTPWKTRAFEATDPDGFKLTIGSELPRS
jgi:uncharacterized glyoxalase superfamily protein PhnB